jgi:anti-sigma regulatory factor (Ser/Thr protein kinase)
MDDSARAAMRHQAEPFPRGGEWPAESWAGVRIPPFLTQRARRLGGCWPLEDFLELGALAGAVPCARLHTRNLLLEWGLARLCESTEIIVSELITNAVKASQAMPQAFSVRLWLASDLAQVLIVVWDASPQPPVRVDASVEAENGRGLMLVEAMSKQWSWFLRGGGEGKFVWASL